MKSRKTHYDKDIQWWLQGGTEQCEFCESWFHYEAGYFCTGCDSQVCPFCVFHVRVEEAVLCPGCKQKRPGGE